MIQAADQVITMGCLAKDVCPAVFVDKVEGWDIEDPAGKSIEKFREVRDEIRKKVEKLIQRIKQSDENEVKPDQC
jgi:arsenate reductase